MNHSVLQEYRGKIVENSHAASIAVVGEDGKVIASLGDMKQVCYYRSTAKPFQVIPALIRELPQKYGFDESEVSILNASHWGCYHHLETLGSMFLKASLKEEDLVMKPFCPLYHGAAKELKHKPQTGAPQIPTKMTHDCTGKHTNLMLLQRELTQDVKDYWKAESAAQQEIIKMISYFSEVDIQDIVIGVDGCGVPVFGVPLTNIAHSYLKLACTDLIDNDVIRKAVDYDVSCIHKYPQKINDFDCPIYYLNKDNNFIAKDGASGIWCVGLKKERLGIAIKMEDGYNGQGIGLVIANVLEQLGCDSEDVIRSVRDCIKTEVVNDNDLVVGQLKSIFELVKKNN